MTNNEYISEERPEDQEPQEETENDTTGSESEPEFENDVPKETDEEIGDDEEEEAPDEEEAEAEDEFEEDESSEAKESEAGDEDEEEVTEEGESPEEEEETEEVESEEEDSPVEETEEDEEEESAEEEDENVEEEEAEENGEKVSEEEALGINLADIGDLITEANQLLDEVSTLRGSIGDVEVEQKEGRSDLTDYQNRMRNWKNKGYNVAGLESVIQTGVEDLAKRVFVSFERDVKRLKEIEKSLDALDTTGFKKKESDIRDNLKNTEMIIPTLKHLIELEIDIRRKMEMDV